MIYYCRDCSYTGKKRTPKGQCPACGSYDYRRRGSDREDGKPQQSSPLKLAFLIGLWAYLIVYIYRKLYS
jgi:predicted ATP-dependent serine protease